jgi:hypothetical protein
MRLNPATVVGLDKTKAGVAGLSYTGESNAAANVLLRLAFDMRTEPGCDKPLVSTGYADTLFSEKLRAKVGPRGLVELHFEGEPTWLSVGVCLYPGDPTKPCAGGLAAYPVKVTVKAIVKISLTATNELIEEVVPAKKVATTPAPKKPAPAAPVKKP